MVDAFHWSIHDIDASDMESLIAFITYYPRWKKQAREKTGVTTQYADEAHWL